MFVQTHHTTGSSCFQSITFPWWALILLAFTAAVNAERTALTEAIDKDDVTAARRAIEQGATFNTLEVWQDALNRSAPDEMFALFLEKGFNPHMRQGDFASPLYAAAAKGRLEVVRMLLKREVDVNATGKSGFTPLMGAAGAANLSPDAHRLVEMLLEAGAKVNASDSRGMTPLHWAARAGDDNVEAVIDRLLKAGAKVDARDNDGRTPLMLLCISTADRSPVWSLLSAGADANAQDNGGNTPLHCAVWVSSSREPSLRVIGYLFEEDADPNLTNKAGWTPVMVASAMPYLDPLRALLRHGGKADVVGKNGWTPATIAIASPETRWWAGWLKGGEVTGIPRPDLHDGDARMVGGMIAEGNQHYSPKVWLLLMYGADVAAGKGPKHDETIYDTQKLLIGRDDSEAARTRQLLNWHRENPMPIEESEGEH